jgi:type 1 glutamine amidotransferase
MEKLYSATQGNPAKKRCAITLMLSMLAGIFAAGCAAERNVLVYTKNGKGYVHENIPASVECLKKICAANRWTCEVTNDASVFTPGKIKTFDVLVFDNTNNETFDTEEQKKVFQDYIRGGGGFVGIHSSCGSERQWPWFWANLGGKFVRHPKYQPFDIKVIDAKHPSTDSLPAVWKWEDECYYMNHLNPGLHVLLAVDLTTVTDDKMKEYPGDIFGTYFPLCWYQEYDGGRQWYTALGHNPKHYQDSNFIKHLTGGIRWAMKKNKKG